MNFQDTAYHTILLFLFNVGENVGLLIHGNSVNSTDTTHGFAGHNIDLADIRQMLLNQTAELENLRQQAENDRSTFQLLLNKTKELENFKRQAENDRTTLQNRVFFLEAELNKLNVSKLPSIQEFSTYLSSMNQLTQNMATNEANDKTLTQRLDVAVKSLDDLKVQVRYTSLSLLDIKQSMTEELNGSLIQFEERVTEHIASKYLIKQKVFFKFTTDTSLKGFCRGK